MRALGFIPVSILALSACSQNTSETRDVYDASSMPDVPRVAAVTEGLEPPMPPVVPNGDGITRLSDIDFASYSMDLAKPLNLEVGELKTSVEDKVHATFRPNKMPDGKGHMEYALTELKAEGGSVLLATAQGLADDSVKAQQLYVIFQEGVLVTYGMKVKCKRGETPNIWQNSVCP